VNPLGAIYGSGVSIRNGLYDRGILRAQRLAAPVISVGNLSVGGSGKTPFVIMLGEWLRRRGIGFDVLSRGYGRHTRGVMRVDAKGSPREFGDEPLLIAQRLNCPVVVGESRYEAGRLAEEEFSSQLHILDDGFQHRSLARDVDIVLLTKEDLNDQLLPAGRLREPVASLGRADIVVIPEGTEQLPLAGKCVWHLGRSLAIADPPQAAVVFCGIARPARFLDQLQLAGVKPAAVKIFRDHHAYSTADVRELLQLRDQKDADGFITTEKDAINLGALVTELGKTTIAQVKMEVTDPADAFDTMLRLIGGRMPQRHEKISGLSS
jgi:tetraacyldisaccharide 4'-kinase